MRVIILLCLATSGWCRDVLPSEVPLWVLKGILSVETRSSYRRDGTIMYVDRRRGRAGEVGPYQVRRIAFEEVKMTGERFYDMERDPIFAEVIACRYLAKLYNRHHRWDVAIQEYNAGPGNRNTQYFKNVVIRGRR